MNANDSILLTARQLRNQALACAILSFVIALALLLSNIGTDRGTANARAAIALHNDLLLQNQSVLRNNEAELARDLLALKMAHLQSSQ
jgi:hypothetical protein